MLRSTILSVVALAGFSLPLGAVQGVSSHAVIIGIDHYRDEGITDRDDAEANAKAMYDLLVDPKRGGVPPANAHLLLGSGDRRTHQLATKRNILRALRNVVANANRLEPVFLVFFGQGSSRTLSSDHRCYFAVDSTVKGRDEDAINAFEFEAILDKLQSRRFIAVVDVTFRGLTDPPWGTPVPSPDDNPFHEFLGGENKLDELESGRSLFVQVEPLALDKPDAFAKAVLGGLQGKADRRRDEADGIIGLDELVTYVNDELNTLLPPRGRDQQPVHFAKRPRFDDFDVANVPEGRAKVKRTLAKFETLLSQKKIPAKYAREGRRLLFRTPRFAAMQGLRKEYHKLLADPKRMLEFENNRGICLAQTKLERAVAERFADAVFEAIESLAENYVEPVTQRQLTIWAIRGLYDRLGKRLPEELDKRLNNIAKLARDEDIRTALADARTHLGKREDLDEQQALTTTLQAMCRRLDPYTWYIDPDKVAKFRCDIYVSFTGIGARICKDLATNQLLVVTATMGSPAYKAGLRTGDLIVTIRHEVDIFGKPLVPPEEYSARELTPSDARRKIRGKRGTKLKFVVRRKDRPKPLTIEVTREFTFPETVVGFHRPTGSKTWDYLIDKKNKIGYIRVKAFRRHTLRDVQTAIATLTQQKMKALILDLRFNPEGLLDQSGEITDLFINDGLITSIRPRIGKKFDLFGKKAGSLLDFPMVCLVNRSSASASEIVAAALQDHCRAHLVGERTQGKGSVQNIQPFKGGALKLTTASFWRANCKCLNKSPTNDHWGVTPDQRVPLSNRERLRLEEALLAEELLYRKGDEPVRVGFLDRQLESALMHLRGDAKPG